MQSKLEALAQQLGERLLHSPGNPISMALTVDSFSTLLLQHQQRNCSAQDDSVGQELHALQQQASMHATEETAREGAAWSNEAPTKEESMTQNQGTVAPSRKVLSQASSATVLGAMLWQRHVSGVRVVCRGKAQAVAGISFDGYGSSCDDYPHDYMTAAAALGACKDDVDVYVEKIRKCWLPQ